MSSLNWHKNDRSLRMKEDTCYSENISELDLNAFPLIDDFEIIIRDHGGRLGLHIQYYSRNLGAIIASFPWWDNVDRYLINMSLENIPLGKMNAPYDDLEQSWQILIWEDGDFVYVIEGDEPCCSEFHIWFKVKKNKYLDEWNRILTIFKNGKEPLIFKDID